MSQTERRVEFNIGELLSTAWQLFAANVGLLLGAAALVMVILGVGNAIAYGLASLVLGGPFAFGVAALTMGVVRRQRPDFNVLFSGFKRFLPAFMANLLVTIFALIGSVFCILPGLFISVLYMLTFYYMYDKDYDFWEAMESSRKTVMANLGQWILLALVIFVLNLVGSIPCGLGLLVTVPLSVLLLGLAYEQVESGTVEAEIS